MEELCSSETSVATQRTTRRHIPEDDTLHNHRCEILKSYITSSRFNIISQRFNHIYSTGLEGEHLLIHSYEANHKKESDKTRNYKVFGLCPSSSILKN
jgi:hypothetical protein